MGDLKGKRILIFQQRRWGMNIGHFLARELQECGCVLGALTFLEKTHQFAIKQKDVKYDKIFNFDKIISNPDEYLSDSKFTLEEICKELGVISIWSLVNSSRKHTRSYKDKYYYGFKQNVSDEVIVSYIKAVHKCIKMFFDEFNPDLIISPNFVSLPHIMFNLYAKKRGTKMIAMTDCKIRGKYIFTHSFKDDEGPFFDRVDQLNSGLIESDNLNHARKYIKEFRDKFKKPMYAIDLDNKKSFIFKIKNFLTPFYRILQWYLNSSKEGTGIIGIATDYRPPRIILRDYLSHWKNERFARKNNYANFRKIGKYIYFPLQYQPEATIDVAAPYFCNQIETARQVAMSMPGDYTLVVKEHPAMLGLRPKSYLEKVDRTVNVKMISYNVPSEEVIQNADLLISPNSTSIAEAAFYNKPVIQLGDLGTTLKLPNVFKHTDMTTLSKKIEEVLSVNLNNSEYERRLENFVSAVYDIGFEFDYLAIWERGEEKEKDKMWQIYKKEIINCI